MKVTVSELISNQEVAVILDDWHLNEAPRGSLFFCSASLWKLS